MIEDIHCGLVLNAIQSPLLSPDCGSDVFPIADLFPDIFRRPTSTRSSERDILYNNEASDDAIFLQTTCGRVVQQSWVTKCNKHHESWLSRDLTLGGVAVINAATVAFFPKFLLQYRKA